MDIVIGIVYIDIEKYIFLYSIPYILKIFTKKKRERDNFIGICYPSLLDILTTDTNTGTLTDTAQDRTGQ